MSSYFIQTFSSFHLDCLFISFRLSLYFCSDSLLISFRLSPYSIQTVSLFIQTVSSIPCGLSLYFIQSLLISFSLSSFFYPDCLLFHSDCLCLVPLFHSHCLDHSDSIVSSSYSIQTLYLIHSDSLLISFRQSPYFIQTVSLF